MANRTELLESALDGLPDGIALMGAGDEVVFWNQAAEEITGYAAMELLKKPLPADLEELTPAWRPEDMQPGWSPNASRGALVRIRHKWGQELRAIARPLVLRNALEERTGTAIVFHLVAKLNTLPRGLTETNEQAGDGQKEFEERLREEFEGFARGGGPLGLLWVMVDQAHELRGTHGAVACEAMMEKVRMALAHGLRPDEEIGRWGEDEFLVVSHERSQETLDAHGRMLVGISRTADFRWWGDRVSLTVSMGAAQARENETLEQLLERAQAALVSSFHGGGNTVTSAAGGET
jgi:diguanylate cyclase (GGDEF)-like protein/PAS domain S-box-containing protein